MMRRSRALLPCLLLSAAALPARAAILAFTFDSASGNEASLPAQIFDPHVLPTSITRGAGFSPAGFPGTFAAANAAPATLANALSGNDYFSFTVTPTTGYDVSVASIILMLRAQNTSTTSPTNYVLMSDATGFQAGHELLSWALTQPNGSGGLGSLSTVAALQNHAGPIEFRLYVYGRSFWDQRAIGNNAPGYDLYLDGAAATPAPEPASLSLLALVAPMLLLRRRR